jgi:hypothetical protein
MVGETRNHFAAVSPPNRRRLQPLGLFNRHREDSKAIPTELWLECAFPPVDFPADFSLGKP